MVARTREPMILAGVIVLVLTASGLTTVDRFTWVLDGLIPVTCLLATFALMYRHVRFTDLTYRWFAFFILILMTGGHWGYAHVPLGDWVKDAFDLSRNHFDRVGHFFQGFVPALAIRELLLRRTPLRQGKALFVTVVAYALAISAFYELIEWWASLAFGDGATEFLGSQGDIWDAQWDMFLATTGSIIAQLTVGRLQDRQIAAIDE